MSVSYNTFVGPYVEVYNPKKDTVEEYYTCLNIKCNNHKKDISDGYCSKCGNRIERASRPVKESITFNCHDEFADNNLCEVMSEYKPDGNKDYMFFVSYKIGVFADAYDTTAIELKEHRQSIEIEQFTKSYTNEIKKLNDVFGKENVTPKWGLLMWCS